MAKASSNISYAVPFNFQPICALIVRSCQVHYDIVVILYPAYDHFLILALVVSDDIRKQPHA